MIDPALQRAFEDMRAGRVDAALASVKRIVKRRPQDHNAAQFLAFLLVQSGKLKAALPYLAAAVAAEPAAVQYRNNYANALLHLKQYAEASEQWERAVQLDPQYALGWLGLACTRIFLSDAAGARAAAERGLELRPGWPEMTRQLVFSLEAAGELDEALALCERALAADPNQAALRSTYLLLLNYRADGAALIEAHREFGRLHARPFDPPHLDAAPDRPLRIGLLSADLRTHSVGFFAEPLLRGAPPWAAVTVFSLAATPDDEMTRCFRGLVRQWIEVKAMDDVALNKIIREQEIDVLIELHGHTGFNRLPALADKPAPVIMTALGYPNTTGLSAVDWRLVDSITDPPGSESLATERLLRLDPCFLCYAPPADAPEPTLPPPSAPITFGSFNALSKISDLTIQMWADVLAAIDGSRLLLKTIALSDPSARTHLTKRLAAAGIAPDRVEIVPHAPTIREHLELYSRIHVALDTTPYNGTTTTCEALWLGVPVVSLLGERHAARVGASLLSAIGRADLIARSSADYVATAVRLANDRAALEQLRFGLRPSMRQSPLLDQVKYADRFYAAVRSCWVDRCGSSSGQLQ